MCIKQTKTLNPKANEWNPNSTTTTTPQTPDQLLPHVILPPPSAAVPEQPAMQVAAIYTPPHGISPIYYYYHDYLLPSCYQQGFIPYDASFTLAHQPFYDHPTTVTFPDDQKLVIYSGGDHRTVESESRWVWCKEKKVVKRQENPPVSVMKNGSRRAIPPRLIRAGWSFCVDKKPPQQRQEWRPKKVVNHKVSGGWAAVYPPPPPPCAKKFQPLSNTTVMIKNIPNQLRRDFMLEFLDGYCKEYSLEYDFFYLPMDFRKGDNLGYAFVNFTTSFSAKKFKEILQNYCWLMMDTDKGPITSKKICDITWARIQGKEAMIKRFCNSTFACDKLDYLPVVLDPPRNGSDPKPSPPVIIGSLTSPGFSKLY